MKGINNFLWFLYNCFAFYTLLVYLLIYWIPFDGWLAGFMMMSFPILIIVHLISIPIWFIIERKKALLPIFLLLLGGIFLSRTYKFGANEELATNQGKSVSVMSYNTHSFMKNWTFQGEQQQKDSVIAMKTWLANYGSDVLCMPEYFSENSKLFNTKKTLESAGYRYNHLIDENNEHSYYNGLALFSKFPIVSSKDTIFEMQNGMIMADIKVGSDTIRIVGVHLFSMTLNLSKLAHQKKIDGVKAEGKITFRRMRDGFKQRSKEIRSLESWIEGSPYPVIVCGDFNEVPYGYVYGEIRGDMANAFEQKGEGFGFTFNHLPYFIRIDHQFYTSDKLELIDFKTLKQIKYSDHYPIVGEYKFR